MERQALLEQKRQRLLELRQRRSEISSVDTENVTPSPEPRVSKRIDFSVQVDLISESNTHASIESTPKGTSTQNVYKFDKSIQTEDLLLRATDVQSSSGEQDDPIINPVDVPNLKHTEDNTEISVQNPQNVISDNLEKQLDAWDIRFSFSDLRLGLQEPKELDPATEPFQNISQLENFLTRPIVLIVSNLHFSDLVLVAYGKDTSLRRSPDVRGISTAGLAVIFNTKSKLLIPEFFLQCTSSITYITFDKSNSAKVFAGLANGQVVMWDLGKVLPTKVALLPTLQTSLIVSKEKSSKNLEIIHHTSPILYLDQPSWESSQDSTFVSLCSGGVVNMWSPNMLAFPKVSSIKIGILSPRVHEQLFISTSIATNGILKQAQREANLDAPEFGFLERILIGTKSGLIQNLTNNKDSLYLGHKVSVPIKRDTLYDSGIKNLAELTFQKMNFLLSVHSDWHLSLWDLHSCKLLCKIPTATAVNGVTLRPRKTHQFVTYGNLKPPKTGFTVEFWDFLVQMMAPLFEIPVKDSQSGTVSFSDDGSILFVGYENGDVNVYSIEDEILNKRIVSSAKSKYDKGLVSILRSIEI